MTKLPRLTARQIVSVLQKAGFIRWLTMQTVSPALRDETI